MSFHPRFRSLHRSARPRLLVAVSLTFLMACGLLIRATAPGSAELRVMDDAPRASLWQRLYRQIPACWRTRRDVEVREVTKAEIERIVARNEGTQGHEDDDASEVDGIYQAIGEHEGDPITITLRDSLRGDEAELVFLHEYGHFVWEEKLTRKDRIRYEHLWEKQRRAGKLVTEYARDSSPEGFAEAFSFYLHKTEVLRRKDGASFGFLHDLEKAAAVREADSRLK